MTDGTIAAALGLGTILALPSLLSVGLTRFVMRRAQRMLPDMLADAARVMDLDRQAAAQIVRSIRMTAILAPVVPEGVADVEFSPISTYSGDGFLARNDRLGRAIMANHLAIRILYGLAAPTDIRRLLAAGSAWCTLLLYTDDAGRIDTADRYERWMKNHPRVSERRKIVIAG